MALALSVLGASTPSQAQVGAIICDGRWQTVPAVDVTPQFGDFNSLNAVATLSSTDVWAVGQWERFAGTDYNHALVEHWDGTSWAAIQTPHPRLSISILTCFASIKSKISASSCGSENCRGGFASCGLLERIVASSSISIINSTSERVLGMTES